MITTGLIVFLVLLILLSGSLSGSETALFSLSPFQLKQYKLSKDKRRSLIAHLMERPRDVLVTLLMLNVLANILIQNTVSSLFAAFPDWSLKVGLPLVLTLVFGEVLPKSLAMPYNTSISYHTAPWVAKVSRWLGPIRRRLTSATSWISRVLFLFLRSEEEISSDELKHVLKTSEESGVLLEREGRLMRGVLDVQESLVKERMRPREEILYYDLEEPLEKLAHLMTDQQITRLPVCEGSLENLRGILSTRAFFLAKGQIKKALDLLPILKKPFYVPETTKSYALLNMLRERSESLAMVVDEYGSISGLITQEDVIEQVVGEIADRRDQKSLYTRSGPDVIIASGKLELVEFKEIFGVELESKENAVTLGGWLIEQLGDIPQAGTQYATAAFFFSVLAAEPNRIRRIYVRRIPQAGKKKR